MRIGSLRHRCHVQAQVGGRDAHGGTAQDYETVATVWCGIEPLSGRELEYGQSVDPRVSHRITMRFRDDLTPRHRLVARGRTFNVHAVLNVGERDREVQVLAEEQAP